MELNWNPENYIKTSTGRVEHMLNTFTMCGIRSDSLPKQILDIGCGEGSVTQYLALMNPICELIAIDHDLKMIEYARQNNQIPNIQYIYDDISTWQSMKSYDFIMSFACLHWMPNLQSVITKIISLLNNKATFIALVYPRAGSLFDIIEDVEKSPKWISFFGDFKNPLINVTKSDCVAILNHFELTSFNVYEDNIFLTGSNEERIDLIRSWLPHLSFLPLKYHDDLLKDITNALPDKPYYKRLIFKAVK